MHPSLCPVRHLSPLLGKLYSASASSVIFATDFRLVHFVEAQPRTLPSRSFHNPRSPWHLAPTRPTGSRGTIQGPRPSAFAFRNGWEFEDGQNACRKLTSTSDNMVSSFYHWVWYLRTGDDLLPTNTCTNHNAVWVLRRFTIFLDLEHSTSICDRP